MLLDLKKTFSLIEKIPSMPTFQKRIIKYYIKTFISDVNIPNIILYYIHLFYDFTKSVTIINHNFESSINNITKCYINGDSLYFITNNSILYVYGDNSKYQLGLNDEKYCDDSYENISSPLYHPYFNSNINKCPSIISSGVSSEHVFVYTISNELYGFGDNNECQLSFITIDPWKCEYKPTLIQYKFQSKLHKIKSGTFHTLFLGIHGDVYGCGQNTYYQLSNKYVYKNDVEFDVHFFKDFKNAMDIGCCESTSFIIDNTHYIYSVGTNCCGELGINSTNDVSKDFNKIKHIECKIISCGFNHICCLSMNNTVYVFGDNSYGACGFTGCNHWYSPKKLKVNISNNDQIIDVKCGLQNTFIKTINNKYYSFGNNKNNQLLLDINDDKIYKPTLINNEYIYNNINCKCIITDIIPNDTDTYIVYSIQK